MKQELVSNSYRVKLIEKNINTITVSLKKNDVILKEVDKFQDNARLFDRIGRMYVKYLIIK